MKNSYKTLLGYFVGIVGFLFAAFGGFLTNIAPPDQSGAQFIVGISSFLALIALLIVAALARSAPGVQYRRRWIIAGVVAFVFVLPATYLYRQSLGQYTWWYPDNKPIHRLRGLDSDFTPSVQDYLKQHPEDRDPKRLARNFEIDQIWTGPSVDHAGSRLSLLYAWLVLSLATSVFCLVEANTSNDDPHEPKTQESHGSVDKQNP